MSASADVIVVGAGVIGCAVAWELGRRGARVRLFEARTVSAGATHASAGVLAPYIEGGSRGTLLDLAVRSLAMYDSFVSEAIADSGIDVEYRRTGTLEIATDEGAARHLQQAASSGALPAGVAQWLSAADARRLEPSLPPSVLGALHIAGHGYVAVPQFTDALSWAALRRGAAIETGRRIVGVEASGTAVELASDDGTTWRADAVVLATGSWAGRSGLSDPSLAHVRPVRGQLVRLAWASDHLRHVLWGPECYVVPWRDGSVLVGATVEDVGFDERTTAAGVRDLLDAVCDLLPEAWRAGFLDARAGLRPATPDGLPLIGPSASVPGVYIAAGHYRNGVLLAPLTASLLADLVLERRSDPALEHLSPGRFS